MIESPRALQLTTGMLRARRNACTSGPRCRCGCDRPAPTRTKKAGVFEHPEVFDHAGLLV